MFIEIEGENAPISFNVDSIESFYVGREAGDVVKDVYYVAVLTRGSKRKFYYPSKGKAERLYEELKEKVTSSTEKELMSKIERLKGELTRAHECVRHWKRCSENRSGNEIHGRRG